MRKGVSANRYVALSWVRFWKLLGSGREDYKVLTSVPQIKTNCQHNSLPLKFRFHLWGEFVLTPISLCWNHQFLTSFTLGWQKTEQKPRRMIQIPRMPMHTTRPEPPSPAPPPCNGWNVCLSLTTGHQVHLSFLPPQPTLRRHEWNTVESFQKTGWTSATVGASWRLLAEVCPKKKKKLEKTLDEILLRLDSARL